MTKIFIDGSAGTTGLRIHERLAKRSDIELLHISDELRKDPAARREMLNAADIAFLCLPDAAAEEAVSLIDNPSTAVIDTSTAHRTAEGWVYGFAELGRREAIAASKRIANPGCHASGFISLVQPLVRAGIVDADAALTCFSLTGYSGGGKKMIAQYEGDELDPLLNGARQYGLTQQHKHLKEMVAVCGLQTAPVFCPVVGNFYSGMEVTVPLFRGLIHGTAQDIREVYRSCYSGRIVHFDESADESGYLSACALEMRDDMQITVCGNEDRILLVSRYDNLGKGASGAAIQNMNILMGVEESTGLVL